MPVLARILPLAAIAALAAPALAHNELQVVRNAANQLMPHMDFEEPPVMELNTFPELPSAQWIGINVGVSTIEVDDPVEGLFTLAGTSNIEMILVAVSTGGQLYRSAPNPMNVGESFGLGNPYFHQHPLWGNSSGNLGDETVYTLRFHDISGTYTDSPDFTITFTNVPAPGLAGLAGVASAFAARRRRR